MSNSPIIVPPELARGYHETSTTPEAAVLRGMGCEPLIGDSCRVDHTSKNPYGSGRGTTVFSLSPTSSTWRTHGAADKSNPLPTSILAAAYRERTGAASVQLDELIEKIPDEELRCNIKNTLPLVIASYGAAFEDQRLQCMALVHSAPRHAVGRSRDGRKFSINVKNQKFARQHGCD